MVYIYLISFIISIIIYFVFIKESEINFIKRNLLKSIENIEKIFEDKKINYKDKIRETKKEINTIAKEGKKYCIGFIVEYHLINLLQIAFFEEKTLNIIKIFDKKFIKYCLEKDKINIVEKFYKSELNIIKDSFIGFFEKNNKNDGIIQNINNITNINDSNIINFAQEIKKQKSNIKTFNYLSSIYILKKKFNIEIN